ncbi:hypothetical protein ACQJBY_012224 [Aegilops geniculata]
MRRRTGERRLCEHRRKEKQQGRGRRVGSRLLASPAPPAATPACPLRARCSSGRPSSPSPCRMARLTSEVTLSPSLLFSSSQLISGHLETWPWDVGDLVDDEGDVFQRCTVPPGLCSVVSTALAIQTNSNSPPRDYQHKFSNCLDYSISSHDCQHKCHDI